MIKRFIFRFLITSLLWVAIPYVLISITAYFFESTPFFLKLLRFIGIYFIYDYIKNSNRLLLDIEINKNNNIVLENYLLFFGKEKLIVPLEDVISCNIKKSNWVRVPHFSISSEMVNQSFAIDDSHKEKIQNIIKTINKQKSSIII